MKGSYIIYIEAKKDQVVGIGKLGDIKFRKGFYAYVGSAMNGVEARVARHLGKGKKRHWHIDYLLGKAKVVGALCIQSNRKVECSIAARLKEKFVGVPGFGCSDCKCQSHLFYSPALGDLIKGV